MLRYANLKKSFRTLMKAAVGLCDIKTAAGLNYRIECSNQPTFSLHETTKKRTGDALWCFLCLLWMKCIKWTQNGKMSVHVFHLCSYLADYDLIRYRVLGKNVRRISFWSILAQCNPYFIWSTNRTKNVLKTVHCAQNCCTGEIKI
jgi:hypothetical protein